MGLIIVPLLFIYAFFAYFITNKLSKIPNKKNYGLLVKIICTAVFVGLVIGDAVIGRIYLNCLCKKDGGIVINETIELGPEYFDKRGRFKTHMKTIHSDKKHTVKEMLFENYKIYTEYTRFGELLKYRKTTYKIIGIESKKIIASSTQYSFSGGWFENLNVGFSKTCPKFENIKGVFSALKDKTRIRESLL